MNDQAFLDLLGKEMRDQSGEATGELNKLLDRLTASDLSAAEHSKLTNQARESQSFDRVYQALCPLTKDKQQQIVDAIKRQQGIPATPSDKKMTFWQLLFRRRQVLAMVASAALVLVVFVLWPQRLVDFPDYELQVGGQLLSQRHAAHAEPIADLKKFRPGGELLLILRPSKPIAHPVTAKVLIEEQAGLRAIDFPMEIDSQGAIRISAIIGQDLKVSSGIYTLWLVVTQPGQFGTSSGVLELEQIQAYPHFSIQIEVTQ